MAGWPVVNWLWVVRASGEAVGVLRKNDGAIFLGAVLMLVGITGLYVDTASSRAPDPQPQVQNQVSAYDWIIPSETPMLVEVLPEPSATDIPQPVVVESTPDERAFDEPAEPQEEAVVLEPTPTHYTLPLIPDHLIIPAINVDAPIWLSNEQRVFVQGQMFQQWEAPMGYAAGWQPTSSTLGIPGNTVLHGHHNVYGAVFARLVDLQEGDIIQINAGGKPFNYTVTNRMIMLEEGQDISVRLENARWLQHSDDERLTLVTCWPQWSNTHRLIIVARPISP
jgi:LPXTG-site transpeptidase (sortase) family protein